MAARSNARDGLGMSYDTTRSTVPLAVRRPGRRRAAQPGRPHEASANWSRFAARTAPISPNACGTRAASEPRSTTTTTWRSSRTRRSNGSRSLSSSDWSRPPRSSTTRSPATALPGWARVVRVRDRRGPGRRVRARRPPHRDAMRTQVTPASPVGEALLGARSGDTVDVTLPNGRQRALTVLGV